MKTTMFGTKLRKLRKAAGMTQADLAKRAGCNPVSISQYEAGVCEPRDERATMLIELVRGGSHPPEGLKAAAPKKRGRPRKVEKKARARKCGVTDRSAPEYPLPSFEDRQKHPVPNCHSIIQPVEPEEKPKRNPGGDTRSAAAKGPVRLGSVSRAWLEQQTASFVHARGAAFEDGSACVVVLRKRDLIDLEKTLLEACGTKVGEE